MTGKKLPPGGLVRLVDSAGGPVGTAMFNPHPLISARLMSPREAARLMC